MDSPKVNNKFRLHLTVAMDVGVNAAIILDQLHYWIKSNTEQGIQIINGRAWRSHTIKKWQQDIPFLSIKQVRTSLDVLRDKGWIMSEQKDASSRLQVMWYALTDKAVDFYGDIETDQKGQMHLPYRANGNALQGKCYNMEEHETLKPYNTPISPEGDGLSTGDGKVAVATGETKTEDKGRIPSENAATGEKQSKKKHPRYDATSDPLAIKLYDAYPLHKGRLAALKSIGRALRSASFDAMLAGIERYKRSMVGHEDYYKHPATWFNQGCWMDEESKSSSSGCAQGELFTEDGNDGLGPIADPRESQSKPVPPLYRVKTEEEKEEEFRQRREAVDKKIEENLKIMGTTSEEAVRMMMEGLANIGYEVKGDN